MPFNNHMSRGKVRNQSLKYLSLIRAGKYFSRSQHPGIEEQKDVAMHLKQGRWMVCFYSEGELVVDCSSGSTCGGIDQSQQNWDVAELSL